MSLQADTSEGDNRFFLSPVESEGPALILKCVHGFFNLHLFHFSASVSISDLFTNSPASAEEQLIQVQEELQVVNEKMNRAIDQLESELQCGICREVIVFVS